jgi:molybdopterin synthase sulfur carrier subunit
LDRRFPGIGDRFCQDGELHAGVAVVVGGSVSALGLLERTGPETEVHFLPAIGGG